MILMLLFHLVTLSPCPLVISCRCRLSPVPCNRSPLLPFHLVTLSPFHLVISAVAAFPLSLVTCPLLLPFHLVTLSPCPLVISFPSLFHVVTLSSTRSPVPELRPLHLVTLSPCHRGHLVSRSRRCFTLSLCHPPDPRFPNSGRFTLSPCHLVTVSPCQPFPFRRLTHSFTVLVTVARSVTLSGLTLIRMPLARSWTQPGFAFVDQSLDEHQALQQLFRPGRTARHVDIHRQELIDPLHGRIDIELAARAAQAPMLMTHLGSVICL